MTKSEFPGQLEDEKVLLVFRRHPIVMRKGLLIVLVAIVIGAVVGTFMSAKTIAATDFFISFLRPIGIAFLVSMIPFMYYWIGWYYTLSIVTNQRFLQIHQEGIFKRRSVNDINLNRILSINYEQRGMVESVLGFGTIIIQTLVGDLIVHKVSKPADRQREMIAAIKESGVELDEQTEAAIN